MRVIAVGTGQALRNARNGDGDVLLVHAKNAEEAFVAEGFGVRRFDLMFNDFVIVGPPSDPAGIRDAPNASAALARIAANAGIFTSRGDDSGTHRKEMALWAETGIDAVSVSGTWYLETRQRYGHDLERGRRLERLCADRSRDLAEFPRISGTSKSCSKAIRSCSINTA